MQHHRIMNLITVEVGGINTFAPLPIITSQMATELGLHDGAGVGRSVPRLQMFLPFIYGVKPYPSAISDNSGNITCCTYVESPAQLEDFFREEAAKMG